MDDFILKLLHIENILKEKKKYLNSQIDETFSFIRKCCEKNKIISAKLAFEKLLCFVCFKKTIDDISVFLSGDKCTSIYTVSSFFLNDCHSFLFKENNKKESMLLVTGIKYHKLFTLEKIISVDFEIQSSSFIKGDIFSNMKQLLYLEKFGYKLHAWFHSHISNGKSSILPSTVDVRQQEDFESGKYPTIGAIFSKDRYVRFFSVDKKFKIVVYGKGVDVIDENTFYIRNPMQI